jgi:hypothetical protein
VHTFVPPNYFCVTCGWQHLIPMRAWCAANAPACVCVHHHACRNTFTYAHVHKSISVSLDKDKKHEASMHQHRAHEPIAGSTGAEACMCAYIAQQHGLVHTWFSITSKGMDRKCACVCVLAQNNKPAAAIHVAPCCCRVFTLPTYGPDAKFGTSVFS